jgi:RsiW-degrading membrane proteinase PrsW (M82 family)
MSKFFRVLTIISMAVGVIGFSFMFFTALIMSPGLGLLSVVLTAVYFVIAIFLLSRLPFWPQKRDGESRIWIYAALLWGGGVAIILTLPIATPVMEIFGYLGYRADVYSWAGAYPEEIIKALGIVVICLAFTQLSRPWHGFIVGGVIGLGFEVLENVLYGASGAQMHQDSDWDGFWETWGLRVLAGPGLHLVCTAIAGWGIGWALFAGNKSRMWRLGTALLWWFVAFAIHYAWNYDLVDNTPMVIKIITVMAIMYYIFARICIRSMKLYRADLGQSYTPAALHKEHAAGVASHSVGRGLVIAGETPRPNQEGHRLRLRRPQERPQLQSE